MTITPEQCRAARSLLDLGQDELAEYADVQRRTIYAFESGGNVYDITIEKIRVALENGGVIFLEDDNERYKSGVALKPDYIAPKREKKSKKRKKEDEEKRKRLKAYWSDRAEGLAMLTEEGRQEFADYLEGKGQGEGDFLGRAAE